MDGRFAVRAGFGLTLLWLGAAAGALAGPPYETDDPVPTDYRNYEIYAYGSYRHDDGGSDATPIGLEVNYGLLPNVQFSVTFPNEVGGFGDMEIGMKYRFLSETRTRPQISFYPSVTLATSTVPEARDTDHGTLFLPLWAQKSIGKWTLFGGGGALLNWDGNSRLSWYGGVAATYDVTAHTNIGIEFARSTGQSGAGSWTDLGAGIIHTLGSSHAVLASVGRAFAPGTIHAYAAYEWLLGPRGSTLEP